ncbi:Hypp7869 [Branchiostoma lanceolatum]|uniref:Hypp7869 protein n=1 Tax=Branchiostoma lanceolatum TaxID=7740 RepID=A0A8J9Z440_BRALA|nr:Hypp7869 [Branchiostoma lanceolatum]
MIKQSSVAMCPFAPPYLKSGGNNSNLLWGSVRGQVAGRRAGKSQQLKAGSPPALAPPRDYTGHWENPAPAARHGPHRAESNQHGRGGGLAPSTGTASRLHRSLGEPGSGGATWPPPGGIKPTWEGRGARPQHWHRLAITQVTGRTRLRRRDMAPTGRNQTNMGGEGGSPPALAPPRDYTGHWENPAPAARHGPHRAESNQHGRGGGLAPSTGTASRLHRSLGEPGSGGATWPPPGGIKPTWEGRGARPQHWHRLAITQVTGRTRLRRRDMAPTGRNQTNMGGEGGSPPALAPPRDYTGHWENPAPAARHGPHRAESNQHGRGGGQCQEQGPATVTQTLAGWKSGGPGRHVLPRNTHSRGLLNSPQNSPRAWES